MITLNYILNENRIVKSVLTLAPIIGGAYLGHMGGGALGSAISDTPPDPLQTDTTTPQPDPVETQQHNQNYGRNMAIGTIGGVALGTSLGNMYGKKLNNYYDNKFGGERF